MQSSDPRTRAGNIDRIEERHVGRRGVVSFAGELDGANVSMLDAALSRAVDRGLAEVWLDLCETTFMDSAGVHLLLRAHKTLARLNRRFVVICPEGAVMRVLVLTDVARVLELYDDRSAAHRAA